MQEAPDVTANAVHQQAQARLVWDLCLVVALFTSASAAGAQVSQS